MGHEFSGYLEQDIPDMPKGTLVTVDPLLSCGHCTPCREGNSHVCQTLGLLGINCDGGMAEYAIAPIPMIVKVPDGVSPKLAAFVEPIALTVHAVNEKSPFILCREFGRHMVANHYGKIINFASLLSYQGGLRVPAYAASKGAVMQFTKSLANEWSKDNVNVNCIVPGYYATEMNTSLLNDPVRNEQITVRIPAGRWGQPEDLVGAAIFLASHASDYVDGIALLVDGGWLGR